MKLVHSTLLLFSLSYSIEAWDTEQLEVFDAVDEVKQNFYELLNISNDATNSEIKSAFRTLSLKLHPDKNKGVDTSEKFRNLVAVYEVLRSSSKRKYYNEVLINGLPNWKSGLFYYRYVRKIAITEVIVILFVIITIGQYLVNWGVYFEKKLTMEDIKTKKKKSRNKTRLEDELELTIPKPSLYDTLPVQIPRFVWFLMKSIPSAFGFLKTAVKEKIGEVNRPPTPEPELEPVRIKTVRKRNKFVVPEGPNFEVKHGTNDHTSDSTTAPSISGGLWTDDDLSDLIRLVKKFPQGTNRRWEKIAETLNRSVPEVTYMATRMKENGYRLHSDQEEVVQVKIKQKTKKDIDVSDGVTNWSQPQQKALEDALSKFTKGVNNRWDRIAEQVSGKNKEECMLRFRYLADDLKKRKEPSDKTEEREKPTEPNIVTID